METSPYPPLTEPPIPRPCSIRITQHLGVDLEKNDPRLEHLIEHIIGEFAVGRQTAREWEALRPLVETHLPEPAETVATS